MLYFGLVVIAIGITYGAYWYYNNKLSADTRKTLENEVKADVKEAVTEAKVAAETTAEGAFAKLTKTIRKKFKNG